MSTLTEKRAALEVKRRDWQTLWNSKPNRDFSTTEAQQLKRWNEEMSGLTTEIQTLDALDAMAKDGMPDGGRSILPDEGGGWASGVLQDVMLAKQQKVADVVRKRSHPSERAYEGLSVGKYVKGIVTGDWTDAAAEKAMSVGTLTAGGHLVPAPMAAGVIDRARNVSRVIQAGAVTIPMETSTLKLARVDNDPAPVWHAENAADVVAADVTLGSITFTARTLPIIVRLSRELFEDAENLDEVVRSSIGGAISVELDRAALYGTGTAPEPRGLWNTSGLEVFTQGVNGAALANYDPFVNAILGVLNDNYTPNAAIMAPRTAAA